MGVSPRVVDWLTQEVSQGSRKQGSKNQKPKTTPRRSTNFVRDDFLFCQLGPHAKFQNPRTNPLARKQKDRSARKLCHQECSVYSATTSQGQHMQFAWIKNHLPHTEMILLLKTLDKVHHRLLLGPCGRGFVPDMGYLTDTSA